MTGADPRFAVFDGLSLLLKVLFFSGVDVVVVELVVNVEYICFLFYI
jgi:hypothetical protein